MAMFRTFFLLWLLALAGCSTEPEPIQVEAEGAPALWQVTGEKGKVWIFGTVHLLPPDTDWQSLALHRAIGQADQLVLEASGLDDAQSVAAIFADMGVSGGNPPIASRVDPELYPILNELDDAIAGPRKVLDHLESWAAALTLASAMSADMGLSQSSGVESVLTLRFRSDNKPVSGLETISQQFGIFDTLPEAEQRKMLNAVLRGKSGDRDSYEKLLAAWMRGDVEGVLQSSDQSILASPVVRDALLDARNRKWADQIAAMLETGQEPFIAVGAAHVAGKGGVPAILAAKGYRVARIQ
jgi:uncharacterized protein YbaP (TraB family)